MRFAGIKTSEQQDLQSLHRVRSRWVKNRTALSNQARGLLLEEGMAIDKSFKKVKTKLEEITSERNSNCYSVRFLDLLTDIYEEFKYLEKKIKKYDDVIEQIAQEDEHCKKLLKIDGVGPKTATAIVAMVGNGSQFKDGRQMSAYFGLVPRQHSSGGKELLLGITKRGDGYIRSLLVHGARSLLYHCRKNPKEARRMQWLLEKSIARGDNKAIVAMANKQARIIWSVLREDQEYHCNHEELLRQKNEAMH